MRNSLPIIVFLLLFIPPATAQDLEARALKDVSTQYMRKHLKVIASDAMKGRDTGSPGNDKAAAHIRRELTSAGLTSMVDDGSFYQRWRLRRRQVDLEDCLVRWRRGIKKATWKGGGRRTADRKFEVMPQSGSGTVKGPVVFVGYGITAPEFEYDDYAQVDVIGKIALCFRGEPRERETTGWNGRTNTAHATFDSKILNAQNHGATALIFVTNPVKVVGSTRRGRPTRQNMNDQDLPVPIEGDGDEKHDFPVLWMDYQAAGSMIGKTGDFKKWEGLIDARLQPYSKAVPKLTATIRVKVDNNDLDTQNICALLEGDDPEKKLETVILGAHYDHVGVRAGRGGDRIFNGADDNGSGTTTLMTIARALGKNKIKTRRSIGFLFFSGEEKGLLGSKFYVEHPLRPLPQTVTMLNMDMVGRNYSAGCQVVGTQFSPDLNALIAELGLQLKMKLEFRSGLGSERILERSDQAPFYRKNIPIAFFTTGLHKDYHKVSDHWNLVKFRNMEKVGRLILKGAIRLANAAKVPEFVDQ